MSEDRTPRGPRDSSLFQLLVESVHDYAIFALDAQGRVASWNAGAQRIKGYTAEEIIGQPYTRFFSEEDRAADVPGALLQRAAAEGSLSVDGWRIRRDGNRFRASVVITALRSPEGDLTGFAKVTRDVTEPYAAQEELRLRERQLRDTQRLAELGSWVWQVEPDDLAWTEQLYEIHGLVPGAWDPTLEGYLERVHPDDRARVRGAIEDAYARGDEFAFEERIVRPDGEIRHLRSRGRATRDDSGRTILIMGACLDITDLKEAQEQAARLAGEQAAREALEAYAAGLRFLSGASQALASSLDYEGTLRTLAKLAVPEVADWCAVDLLEGGEVLRRVAVAHDDPTMNVEAEELAEHFAAGRSSGLGAWQVIDSGRAVLHADITEDLLARAIEDVDRRATVARLGVRSVIIVPLAGRGGVLGTLTLVQASSGRRFNEQDLSLVEELGHHAGLAVDNARLYRETEAQNQILEEQAAELEQQPEELQNQAHHLDELMAALEVSNEELAQRTEDAEAANRAKSDFLATMSHELRTPLNAIFGYADLLDMGLHGPVTGAQREALERIKRNQRALLVLVNDVLNFAKLEAGKLELNIGDVSLAEVVADVAAVVSPQLAAKGLSYRTTPFREGLMVRGEQERIEQILLNLLTNAGKFTPHGGDVLIEVEDRDTEVCVHVRDTGPGVPAERLQAIFDPFVQVDRQVEDTGERGVGLGLAISRDLAAAMGGSLMVESTVGEGSTFTLTLPRVGRAGDDR